MGHSKEYLDLVRKRAAKNPGLLAAAVNFAGAVVRHARNGGRAVPEGEYRRRLALCQACPELDGNTCRRCGCRVAGDVVAKCRWASEACPLGRWGAYPGAPDDGG